MSDIGYNEHTPQNPAAEAGMRPSLLGSLLADITDRGGTALQVLQETLQDMQDYFLETLCARLDAAHVDMTRKIVLVLTEEEKIALSYEHPDQEKIEGVLAACTDLEKTFQDMAHASALIHDLRSMRKTISSAFPNTFFDTIYDDEQLYSKYRLSFKGGMSHSYFR